MNLVLSTLDRRRPIFVELVECGRAADRNFHVIEQTYAESLAEICAATDDFQRQYAKRNVDANANPVYEVDSLKILVRTKPSKSAIADSHDRMTTVAEDPEGHAKSKAWLPSHNPYSSPMIPA